MKLLLLALLPLLLASCVDSRHWTERAAQDRIMLVRAEPESLGHKRLVYQAASHPDFARFLQTSGEPDFIAETSNDSRQYMILYYLDTEKAFACRSWRNSQRDMEFAGPIPLRSNETDLLRKLRDGSIENIEPEFATRHVPTPE